MQMYEDEIWKPVKGYEGLYEVSSYWRARSIDRYDRRGTFHKGRMLKLRKSDIYDGLYIRLCKDGTSTEKDIGYVIAHAFHGCENIDKIMRRNPEFLEGGLD